MDTSTLADAPFPEVDRRQNQRHCASYRASVRLASTQFANCCTNDIGGGGVAVWSHDPLVVGSTVQLALQLPDTHKGGPRRVAMASAVVVVSHRWGTRSRVGLAWATPNTAAVASLMAWLQARPR